VTVRRFRVLLISSEGDAMDGFYQHLAEELPDESAEIDVRDGRDRTRVLRARVTRIDEDNVLPIAAVAL
jgi:hypothetical protein